MATWPFAMALERLEVIPSAAEPVDQTEDAGRAPPCGPFDRRNGSGIEDFAGSYGFSRI